MEKEKKYITVKDNGSLKMKVVEIKVTDISVNNLKLEEGVDENDYIEDIAEAVSKFHEVASYIEEMEDEVAPSTLFIVVEKNADEVMLDEFLEAVGTDGEYNIDYEQLLSLEDDFDTITRDELELH